MVVEPWTDRGDHHTSLGTMLMKEMQNKDMHPLHLAQRGTPSNVNLAALSNTFANDQAVSGNKTRHNIIGMAPSS